MSIFSGKKLILTIVCIAVLIVQIDTSVVNLAIKYIGTDLQASVSKLQWVVDAYNLLYASFLLTGAALGDLYGHKRIFALGSIIFVIGSFICGIAQNIDTLIYARVVTGFGASLMLPVSLSIIAVTFPEAKQRAKVIGIWASCNGIAFVVGPTLGGWLVAASGWRSIFFMVIPFGVLAIIGAMAKIPNTYNHERKLDILGQISAIIFLSALTIVSIEGVHWGWSSKESILCFIVLACALLFFLYVESKQKNPLIPLQLFKHKTLASSLLVASLMTFGMYALLFIVPIYLLSVLSITPIMAGVALLPMSLSFVIVSQRTGSLIERFNYRKVMLSGMFLMSFGTSLLALLLTTNSFWLIEASLLIIGIGLGLNTAPVVAISLQCVEQSRAGTVSGLSNTSRMIGATLGVAIIGSIFSSFNNTVEMSTDAIEGFKISFGVAAAFLFIGVLIVYFFIRNNPQKIE